MSGEIMLDISTHFKDVLQIIEEMKGDKNFITLIDVVGKLCVRAYQSGNKIMIAGNGGSAADAQHFAGELVSRFYYDRPPLAAIALTTDTSIITAIGNDYGYRDIFSRQIKALGRSGDVFIAITTSGNSENILSAVLACKQMNIDVIGLTGKSGGLIKEFCDQLIRVPSESTPRIQECHLIIEHAICAYIESVLFPKTIL